MANRMIVLPEEIYENLLSKGNVFRDGVESRVMENSRNFSNILHGSQQPSDLKYLLADQQLKSILRQVQQKREHVEDNSGVAHALVKALETILKPQSQSSPVSTTSVGVNTDNTYPPPRDAVIKVNKDTQTNRVETSNRGTSPPPGKQHVSRGTSPPPHAAHVSRGTSPPPRTFTSERGTSTHDIDTTDRGTSPIQAFDPHPAADLPDYSDDDAFEMDDDALEWEDFHNIDEKGKTVKEKTRPPPKKRAGPPSKTLKKMIRVSKRKNLRKPKIKKLPVQVRVSKRRKNQRARVSVKGHFTPPPTPEPSDEDGEGSSDYPPRPEPRPHRELTTRERITEARIASGQTRHGRVDTPWGGRLEDDDDDDIPHRNALFKVSSAPKPKTQTGSGKRILKKKKKRKSIILRPKLWKTR